jgi:hypothetical protein
LQDAEGEALKRTICTLTPQPSTAGCRGGPCKGNSSSAGPFIPRHPRRRQTRRCTVPSRVRHCHAACPLAAAPIQGRNAPSAFPCCTSGTYHSRRLRRCPNLCPNARQERPSRAPSCASSSCFSIYPGSSGGLKTFGAHCTCRCPSPAPVGSRGRRKRVQVLYHHVNRWRASRLASSCCPLALPGTFV